MLEQEAEALWQSIANAEHVVFGDALSFHSVRQFITDALSAAEARGRQQAEQALTDRAEAADLRAAALMQALKDMTAQMRSAIALARQFNVPVIDEEGLLAWADQLDAALTGAQK